MDQIPESNPIQPNQPQPNPPSQPSNPSSNMMNDQTGGLGFNVNDVNKASMSAKPSGVSGSVQNSSLVMNIGKAGSLGEDSKVKLSKSTLAGMYQSIDSPVKGRGFDLNIKGILNYTVLLVNLAAIGAIIFLVLLPQYELYVSHQTEIVTAEQEFRKVEAHYTYIKSLEKLQEELYKNIDVAQQAVTVEEEVPQFLNQISKIAEESNVLITKNDFSGASRAPTQRTTVEGEQTQQPSIASTINVRTSVVSSYDNLIIMLAKLENARRIVQVSDMQLSLEKEDEVSSRTSNETEEDENAPLIPDIAYNLDLTLTGYYMKDPDISALTIEQLVAKQGLPDLITKLKAMKYYELTDIEEVGSGRPNPFGANEAVGFEEVGAEDTETTNEQPIN